MKLQELNIPVFFNKLTQLVSKLNLSSSSKVLDIGCGSGSLLSHIAKIYQCRCIGIDPDTSILPISSLPNLSFLAVSASDFEIEKEEYDLIICTGSSHAYGLGPNALKRTLESTVHSIKKHGHYLLGEGFWRQEPSNLYLDLFGEKDIILTPDKLDQLFQTFALQEIESHESSKKEWIQFEQKFLDNTNLKYKKNPSEENRENYERAKKWNRIFHREGIFCLGFKTAVLQKSRLATKN